MMEYLVYLNSQHYGADCPSNGPASPSVSPVGNWPRHSTPIPSSLTAISTTVSSTMTSFMTDSCSPIGFICGVTTSATDPLMSTPKSLCCSDQDPASAAAYLHLLGESLSLIGHHLQETDVSRFNLKKSFYKTLNVFCSSLTCILHLACINSETRGNSGPRTRTTLYLC